MKREIGSPILFLTLSFAFAFVSFMVILRGTNGSWVRRKLRLGALLLTLSGVVNSCGPEVSCYEKPAIYHDSTNTAIDSLQIGKKEIKPDSIALPDHNNNKH